MYVGQTPASWFCHKALYYLQPCTSDYLLLVMIQIRPSNTYQLLLYWSYITTELIICSKNMDLR